MSRLFFKYLLLLFFAAALKNSLAADSLSLRLKAHTAYLASDQLKGRATGSEGERQAAAYIIKNLKQNGVLPFAGNGSYLQPIPMHGATVKKSSKLCILTPGDTLHPCLSNDYLLYKSGAQTYIPKPVPLVFAGYGISAPEFDYDDYRNIDVEGKIVVFFEGEPLSDDPDFFDGTQPTIYSYAESKQRTALARGAIGSILISRSDEWADKKQAFQFEDITLAYRVSGHLGILMHPEAAKSLFRKSYISLEQARRMARENTLYSFALRTKLMFRGRFAERDFSAANVIGYVPGKKNEYLIISAHYDHLGVGTPVKGDSIYNGAMDNAMGVAAVLELARHFGAQKLKNRYGIIFLFVTGEEEGLLGSAYYTDHPVVPLYKTLANVNVDGLAAFDRFKKVVGVGAELSSLGAVLQKTAVQNQMSSAEIPPQFLNYESFSRSDQMSFAWAGVPSILIMDGIDYEHLSPREGLKKWLDWNKRIYHTPFDDMNQPICWAAAAQHTRFLFDFCTNLLNTDQKPRWNKDVPFYTIRLQTIAEER